MSKWKKEPRITETEKQVAKNCNKKGKLKCKKKEKKVLKGLCNHNMINKKGKRKMNIVKANEKGIVYCNTCGRRFSTELYTPEKLNEIWDNATALVDQLKFMVPRVGGSEKNIDYINKVGGMMVNVPKLYKKTAKVVDKHDNFKKKKTRGGDRGMNSYGSWVEPKH